MTHTRSEMLRIGQALLLAMLAMALLGTLTACKSGPPKGKAGITGTVTRVDTADDGTMQLMVESSPGASGQPGAAASVRVDPKTPVVFQDGKDARAALKLGVTAEVWFKGAVAESYPLQGTAAYVRVGSTVPAGATNGQ